VLVEGVVIVASILFAFAIDAWWDERIERGEEVEILDSLEIEYRANLDLVTLVADGHLSFRKSVEEMMARSEEEIRALPQETLSYFVLSMCQPWTFDGVLGTTDALIGAGKLDVLSHSPLRSALTSFLNYINDAAEDAHFLMEDAMNVWRAEVAIGGPWSDPATETGTKDFAISVPAFLSPPTADDVIRILEDKTLTGLIGRCHLNTGYYLTELELLKGEAIEVLELIEESR
jgi:hypothetical protein